MTRTAPWQSYRKVTTQTAPPEHLVLMLYDGAIKYLEQAAGGFRFTDPLDFNQTINNNIHKAQAIIHEMNARLNMEEGGEVSQNFRQLYNYFYRRLNEANRTKKQPPLDEVIRHLRVMRDAWAEMLRRGPASADDGRAAA